MIRERAMRLSSGLSSINFEETTKVVVERIAEHVHADAVTLAQILREP